MTDPTAPTGTAVPRWTIAGAPARPGRGRRHAPIATELAEALRATAVRLDAPPAALLLAAHLKVLAAITAERELVTGLLGDAGTGKAGTGDRSTGAAGGTVAVTLPGGSWTDLVGTSAQALEQSATGCAGDVETLLDLRGESAVRPGPQNVLAVCYDDALTSVTVDYRRDAWTGEHAERLVGYQLAALRHLAADPAAAHDEAVLLTDAELEYQRSALCGPRRALPDALFVDLFEARARQCADQTAAIHGELRWTYRELNERANRIADRLLYAGLTDEAAVAVATGRTLDWLAALLGVLKAGGVYLPIHPEFPAGRVADQLARADCRFAVTDEQGERTVRAAMAEAGRECAVLSAAAAYREGADGNPGRRIAPDQLAYIYFTSGSTGAPKGAMCEHAGMLNHLYMKVEDMCLDRGDTVTETATQCFDISLWQLLAPLMVGGSTAIVDTEVQLDVARFAAYLAAGGVQVIQIVPAYLDVLVSHLERHPQQLGDLRSVSVTGEALKLDLVRRWFAVQPGISLVNAYGATEVCDDTMHAVLEGPPERDLAIVNVGRSLRNVNTYILDEQLRIVPLGAPGEIAFSGVCVGRGYINDPERTAAAFTTDPYLPGTRLYRTGDYGRWLPEGTIQFLGRRDEQVKIRGFRIEIGEIESRLRRMPGVTTAAVLINGGDDQTRHLVAFYSGSPDLQPADLRDFLAAGLPQYMIPAYFHRLDALPLSENGKTDKKRLRALATALEQQVAAYEPPATATERRLATAWAEVLGVLVGRIGRDDDFFRLGGTSLAAVRLVVRLDRLISLRELTAHPVLRDLAAAVDAASANSVSPQGLLQPLSGTLRGARGSLVCFPYAGGNAVNFQLLARELAPAGIAVYGVELPAHDVARPDEVAAGVEEISRRVLAELPDGPVSVWGHCAGAAHALELARLMEAAARPPERLFLGALMLDPPALLEAESARVQAMTNRDLTARLREDSAYVELDLLKAERADLLGRAYRHDVCSSNDYLLGLQRPERGWRLAGRIEVVAAADDPTTGGAEARHAAWEQVADSVGLHLLDEGGHYFVRTRAAQVAALVAAVRSPA